MPFYKLKMFLQMFTLAILPRPLPSPSPPLQPWHPASILWVLEFYDGSILWVLEFYDGFGYGGSLVLEIYAQPSGRREGVVAGL